MAARRSKKKRQAAARRVAVNIRLWLIAIALGLVVLLGVAELISSGRGAALRARVFGPRDLTDRAERLDSAVEDALVRLDIHSVSTEEAVLESSTIVVPHWERSGRIPHGESLFAVNLEITETAREHGGRVVRVWERGPDWRGLRTLDIRLGIGDAETHRLVLKESAAEETAVRQPARPPEVAEEHAGAPLLAIVIDDFGYNLAETARAFIELDHAITISVLPHCPRTREAAEAAHDAGKEVMAHMPMEPVGYPDVDPGEGVLLEGQTADELRALAAQAIDDVPYAAGVNNHMGSRLTTLRPHMRAVMRTLRDRGLYYVDSMTSSESIGHAEAVRAGVPTARNTMFLDSYLDETGRTDAAGRLRELGELARRRGAAIGIGHPNGKTLDALRRVLPELERQGIRVVPASEIAH